jgi:hypothetical protein
MGLLRSLNYFSLRYLALRATTSTGAVIAGLVQTFVFARVLTPDLFSIFILVGTLGLTLWLFDLGIAKILFVRLRAAQFQPGPRREITDQATAVVWLYAAIVLAGGLFCFGIMAARPNFSMLQASEFGLFFVFSALNLVWFVLRNLSIAVDEFLYFESLEVIRRCAHIAVLLAMLIGLPLFEFVILANLIWAGLIALSVRRLLAFGALSGTLRGVPNCLRMFFKRNRSELLRSGSFAAGELYIYNFPYLLVPFAFGLGAPTIVLDTTFKIFRGAALIYAVGCDIAVPRQTRAFAEGDAPGLVRVTLMAFAVSAVPTAILCALLYFGADRIFALLLGSAVTMPQAAGPILIVLIAANIVQNFSTSLMIHTGFFRDMSRLAIGMAALLTIASAGAIAAGLDIVGFLIAYTCVYVAGAVAFVALALYGPVQSARARPAQA